MQRPVAVTIALIVLVAAAFGAAPAAAQSSTWTAEYFSNPSLIGPPTLVRTESSPSNDWGAGSPAVNIPADNFSARWTTTAFLDAGTYQISVRADDGVRVFVNGVAYIDQWVQSPGNFHQATVALPAGSHTFVVEYFEAAGLAYIAYNFGPGAAPPPPDSPQATVTAYFLNVRATPDPFTGAILTRISRGQTFPVIGRSANWGWLQLNVNNTVGWVNASYVNAQNIAGVPVTDGSGGGVPQPPVGITATVTAYFLNVRAIPNPFTGAILTRISRGQTFPVVGRNADTSWLQLNVNGLVGWVNSRYVFAPSAALAPITDAGSQPAPPQATATVTAYFLNVRSAPNPNAWILTIISRGQTFPVIGRNAAGTWVQLNVGGTIGWVNRGWVAVSALWSLPITG